MTKPETKPETTEKTETAKNETPTSAQATAKVVVSGDKLSGRYLDPSEIKIVGIDREAPTPADSPILHRLHQPERLVDIRRPGALDDLIGSILSVGEVTEAVTVVRLKGPDGKVQDLLARGRRRVLASRAINEALAKRDPAVIKAFEALGKEPTPILLKVLTGAADDPKLWQKIISENTSRASESALATAANVTRMLAGDPVLGVPKMSHAQVGEAFGKNHQFSRAMAMLDKASDKVKDAVRTGRLLSATAAATIASIEGHAAQDEALELALASEGGLGKVTKALAAGKGKRGDGTTKVNPLMTVAQIRETLAGLAEIATDPSVEDHERRDALAQHCALSMAIGDTEVLVDEATIDPETAEELYLLAKNAHTAGVEIVKAQAGKAAEAAAAEATAKKAAEAADAKAAKEKATAEAKAVREAERATKKAEKQAAVAKAKNDKQAARDAAAAKATAPAAA